MRITKRSVFALIIAVIMLAAVSVPAFALNATVNGGTTSFTEKITLPIESPVPNATFAYAVEGVYATDGIIVAETRDGEGHIASPRVYATADNTDRVEGLPTVSSPVVFSADTPAVAKSESDKKVASCGAITVDFGSVTFKCPGVFRFKLSCNLVSPVVGLTDDELTDRYIDVYVQQNPAEEETDLFVIGYTLHRAANTIPNNGSDWDAEEKDDGFQAYYESHALTLGKQITGNGGYRKEVFEFTLNLEDAPANSRLYVAFDCPVDAGMGENTQAKKNEDNLDGLTAVSEQEADVLANIAPGDLTWYYVTTDDEGKLEENFYLSNMDTVLVTGLTEGTEYTITEDDKGYDASVTTGSASGVVENEDLYVVFTNHRQIRVATGVTLTVVPVVILAGAAICGYAVIRRKRSAVAE